jgi:hypothetical protein
MAVHQIACLRQVRGSRVVFGLNAPRLIVPDIEKLRIVKPLSAHLASQKGRVHRYNDAISLPEGVK